MITIGEETISSSDFKKMFLDYMISHSDRKLNMLFWNATAPKQRLLVFANLDSDKLVKINNNELIFRMVRVKNKRDWILISTFINDYILKTKFEAFSATITIKLNSLLSYLNNIDYDVTKINVQMNSYFSYSYRKDDKDVMIGNLERDYLALYRLSQMIHEYNINEKNLLIEEEGEKLITYKNFDVTDIKELIIEDTEHIEVDFNSIDPDIKNIKTYISPGSEMMSLKILRELPNKTTSIYMIIKKITDDAFKLIVMISTPVFDVISTRPYVEYYKYKPKKNKKETK